MKALGTCLRIFAALLAVVTLAAFVVPLVQVTVGGATATLNGLQITFGHDLSEELGQSNMLVFKGGYYFGALVMSLVTAVTLVWGLFSKKNGLYWTALVTGLLNAIFYLVFLTHRPHSYVDFGRIVNPEAHYTAFFVAAAICSFVLVVAAVAALLCKDAAEAKAAGRPTIPAKIVKFLREYKSELKKVVWPNGRSVLRNTLVVLCVCAFALALIALVDLGLSELFKLCFGA